MSFSSPPAQAPLTLRNVRWRVAVVCAVGLLCLAAIATVFWEQDGRYARPTPVPAGYHPVASGATLDLADLIPPTPNDRRLTLLHFYNPACPCSRFNATHLAELRSQYGDRVRFVIVAPLEEESALPKVRKEFPGAEVLADHGGRLAQRCGVYSTPQAVILTAAGELRYRGNYNLSRYCDNPATEFARLVLASALAGQPVPPLPPEATTAYGCQLPTDQNVFTN